MQDNLLFGNWPFNKLKRTFQANLLNFYMYTLLNNTNNFIEVS
jgi:hypothetical protein